MSNIEEVFQQKIIPILDDCSLSEVSRVKHFINSYLFKRMEINNKNKEDAIRNYINEGDEVVVKYKDTSISGQIRKKNEKSFSIDTIIDGEFRILSRKYSDFIAKD